MITAPADGCAGQDDQEPGDRVTARSPMPVAVTTQISRSSGVARPSAAGRRPAAGRPPPAGSPPAREVRRRPWSRLIGSPPPGRGRRCAAAPRPGRCSRHCGPRPRPSRRCAGSRRPARARGRPVGRRRARSAAGRRSRCPATTATQDVPCRRSRARSSAVSSSSAPTTATSRPPRWLARASVMPSASTDAGRRARGPRAGPAAARRRAPAGSDHSCEVGAVDQPHRRSRARPGGARPRPSRSPPTRARRRGPRRGGPTARRSTSTLARLCQGCSSRRTISSPRRAVERQCTRRRSSPWRYSRVATSSSPDGRRPRGAGCRRGRPSRRASGSPGSACTGGVTISWSRAVNERVSSPSPNGSVSRTASGPTVKRPRTSERTV